MPSQNAVERSERGRCVTSGDLGHVTQVEPGRATSIGTRQFRRVQRRLFRLSWVNQSRRRS